MTTSKQKFAEYLSGYEQGHMTMRLGHTVYVEQGKDIFAENRAYKKRMGWVGA